MTYTLTELRCIWYSLPFLHGSFVRRKLKAVDHFYFTVTWDRVWVPVYFGSPINNALTIKDASFPVNATSIQCLSPFRKMMLITMSG